MRLVTYLDELGWTQSRLAKESNVSISSIRRMLLVEDSRIQRQKAEQICKTLSNALGRQIRLQDVDEIRLQGIERPERRKHNQPENDKE